MDSDIGFIGLGNMGYGMASNVRKKMNRSITLVINDVNLTACRRFVDEHSSFGPILIAGSPREIAERASTIVTMVPEGKHVKQIYLDERTGIIASSASSERLLIESSTIDIKTCLEVGQATSSKNLGHFVDAPVSGGVVGAATGTLTFMIGLDRAARSVNDPILRRIDAIIAFMADPKKVFFTGRLGSGLGAKVANNYAAFCLILATAEAMAFGERTGVDPKTLHAILKASSGSSWHLDHNPCMPDLIPSAPSTRGFAPAFRPFMAVKDLALAIEAAKDTGIQPVCGEAAIKTYQRAAAHTETKDLDCTSVWLFVTGQKQ